MLGDGKTAARLGASVVTTTTAVAERAGGPDATTP